MDFGGRPLIHKGKQSYPAKGQARDSSCEHFLSPTPRDAVISKNTIEKKLTGTALW